MKKKLILVIVIILLLVIGLTPNLRNYFFDREEINSPFINYNAPIDSVITNTSKNLVEGDKFGLNVNVRTAEEINFSLSVMDDLGVGKTRFFENWVLREPAPGEESWKGLDTRINTLYESGKNFIITLKPVGITNDKVAWYCQKDKANINSCVFKLEYEDDFEQYIKSIIERYPGKINNIQFSNEWDSEYHFKGSAQDYVKYANILYDTVKNNSPDIIVSLGSITKWPLLYVASCQLNLISEFYTKAGELLSSNQIGNWCSSEEIIQKNDRVNYVLANAKYDMLDIHLYDDPENWDYYIQALDIMNTHNKPVIATEFGGPEEEELRYDPYDESFQASELQRYLDKLAQLPILEAYYFRMIGGEGVGIGHPLTGLMKIIDGVVVKKQNYNVFKNRLK